MGTSVFTDYLKALACYSEQVDTGRVSQDGFAGFQELKGRIANAYQKGYFQEPEYEALTAIYHYIHDGFIIMLRENN